MDSMIREDWNTAPKTSKQTSKKKLEREESKSKDSLIDLIQTALQIAFCRIYWDH